MVDLRAKPFDLNEKELRWVEDTIASMSLDEKLSQLFVLLKGVPGADEAQIRALMESARPGGMRWQGGDKETVARQNALFQKYSRIPVFVAANCDDGGIGVLPKEGTFVATAAEAGASAGTETAYRMGYVAGREASAVGVNWMFNPVADLYKNWRNTIVNTRSFGSDPDKVTDCVRAYIRGIKDANPHMACTCKHFPGDGWDELDPHNSPAFNGDTVEDWMAGYGRVYRTMIEEGLEAVMTGQISFPAWSRKVRPGLTVLHGGPHRPARLAAPHQPRPAGDHRARQPVEGADDGAASGTPGLQRAHHLGCLAHDRHGRRHGTEGCGAAVHRRRLRHVPVRQRL